jgi:hypothetical protein
MHFASIRRDSDINRFINLLTACSLLGMITGCGEERETTRGERAPLVAVCTETADTLPDGAWLCGAPRTIECDAHPGTASPSAIYVVRPAGCNGAELMVEEGPFELGTRRIIVTEPIAPADAGEPDTREVCRSTLTVVDTVPPSLTPLDGELWPPSHDLHAITAEQCAGAMDICDPTPDVRFTSAMSDEPVDATGDGSHEPDIVFSDASTVSLRAERMGGKNGRVYTLAVSARDDSGNLAEGVCHVDVPHDQSGRAAVTDPSAYVIEAP